MNMSPHKLIVVVLLFCATGLMAQSSTNNTPTFKAVQVKNTISNNSSATLSKANYTSPYRFHKRLSGTYSGFAIELTASNLPLGRSADIFQQFGNVFYDKLSEGGYSYVIKTNFTKKESLEKFYNNIILPKAQGARMVKYNQGKRQIL